MVRANWFLGPVLAVAAAFGMTKVPPGSSSFMLTMPAANEYNVGRQLIKQYKPDVEVEDFIVQARRELKDEGWMESYETSRIPRARFWKGPEFIEIVFFEREQGDPRSAKRPPVVFYVQQYTTFKRVHRPLERMFGEGR